MKSFPMITFYYFDYQDSNFGIETLGNMLKFYIFKLIWILVKIAIMIIQQSRNTSTELKICTNMYGIYIYI